MRKGVTDLLRIDGKEKVSIYLLRFLWRHAASGENKVIENIISRTERRENNETPAII